MHFVWNDLNWNAIEAYDDDDDDDDDGDDDDFDFDDNS